MKANQDIRDYMADRCVTQKDVALAVGTNQGNISKQLQTELSQNDKEVFLNIIDSIVEERNESVAEIEPMEDIAHTEDEGETTGTKFQVGDRVKIPSKSEKIGIISDIWYSMTQDKMVYAVQGEDDNSFGLYRENQLEPAPLPITYSFDALIDGNAAVVCMNATQGEKTWVYARGHAHILHDGAVGMAQAISYAAKRMFEALDKAQTNQIYFKPIKEDK